MIQQTLGTTTIQQLTDKAIIDWQRFGIDANELVRFVQPSEMAVSLNRVTGSDPSVILGKLQANGQVFLVNPNGWVEPGIALATSFDSAALYCCFR